MKPFVCRIHCQLDSLSVCILFICFNSNGFSSSYNVHTKAVWRVRLIICRSACSSRHRLDLGYSVSLNVSVLMSAVIFHLRNLPLHLRTQLIQHSLKLILFLFFNRTFITQNQEASVEHHPRSSPSQQSARSIQFNNSFQHCPRAQLSIFPLAKLHLGADHVSWLCQYCGSNCCKCSSSEILAGGSLAFLQAMVKSSISWHSVY